jgi:hypothetical protein
MIEVPITADMVEAATLLADTMGEINNSIRKGEGNVYGFLGELVFMEVAGGFHYNTYDWDVVFPDGSTVDVKTKCVTSPPKPHYDCSVASIGTQQNCDYYAFVRVLEDLTVGWYLGTMLKENFLHDARFLKAGIPDGDNGWSPTIDCYNVKISDLGYANGAFPSDHYKCE